jgi:3-deoxy-7-phosphoheptulonate synthase
MFYQRDLPTPAHIQKLFPLSLETRKKVLESRKKFQQFDNYKKALFVGPCSIHHLPSDLLLGKKINDLQREFPEFYFLYRCHMEKPRSNHFWRGFLMDPDLDGNCAIEKGIELSRQFMMELVDMGLHLSYEFIDPFLAPYVEDLVTVGMIGARTVYSQTHRQLAANLKLPIIFKNGIDGRLEGALDALSMAQKGLWSPMMGPNGPQMVFGQNLETHMMLRGGFEGPNLDLLSQGVKTIQKKGLNSKIFIDCAHQNSLKDPLRQKKLFQKYLFDEIAPIHGLMAECHLEEGNQPFSKDAKGGLSITDPCVGLSNFLECFKRV